MYSYLKSSIASQKLKEIRLLIRNTYYAANPKIVLPLSHYKHRVVRIQYLTSIKV